MDFWGGNGDFFVFFVKSAEKFGSAGILRVLMHVLGFYGGGLILDRLK